MEPTWQEYEKMATAFLEKAAERMEQVSDYRLQAAQAYAGMAGVAAQLAVLRYKAGSNTRGIPSPPPF